MNIGKRIKERRTELGMSADELAEKLGKNRSTIYRYENGDIENLPIDILEPIAEALQTTPADLMGWSEKENDYNFTNDLLIEFHKIGYGINDIHRLIEYAKIFNNNKKYPEEVHNAYFDLFIKIYDIQLSIKNLDDIYTYALFIKSKN